MRQRFLMTRRSMLFSLVGLMLTTMLTIWGCGGSDSTGNGSYKDPTNQVVTTTTTISGNALVTADELKAWMDEGKVNADFANSDRVVILDIGNSATYDNGHIPGAQNIAAGSAAFMDNARAEGPFNVTGSMVCTGKTIDALVQAAGITDKTTIVLTTASGALNLTRAYATLRYWGFDKKRIKVLQGGNAAWTTAGYEFTKAVPKITASSFAVAPAANSTRVNTAMRTSLAEMINYVKDIVNGNPNNVVVLDTVRPASQVTSTTDLIDTGNTPMEGAIKDSYRFPLAGIISGVTFQDADTIKARISEAVAPDNTTVIGDANRDATKIFITMCRAGNNASQAYFALDGIAYYDSKVDVQWYDGSYGQWNLLVSKDKVGTNGNAGGQLAVGSIWDTTDLMANLIYTVDKTPAPAVVQYANRVYVVEPSFANGNQLEDEDRAYRSVVAGSGGGGGGASAGGGC